jgi:ribosomal-protein-alanine N-acetyltransferase
MWRPARADEVARLWPAARAANVAVSVEALEAFRAAGPWRVRVSDAGDAMVLRRWRAHLDVLAIRAAWVPPHRVGWLVAEARAVARAQGYGSVVSPLVARSALDPYLAAGMEVCEPIVALQGSPRTVAAALRTSPETAVRPADADDVTVLTAVDARCFDDFWRYGAEEFVAVLESERVVVAERGGVIVGYSSAQVTGSTCTLGRLAVDPDARRTGVGGALLRDAASYAASVRALALSLCTQEDNLASRALYRSAGLIEVGERYAIALCPAADVRGEA